MKLKDLFRPFHPGNIRETGRILREDGSLPEIVEPFVYNRGKHFHILKEMTRSVGPIPGNFMGMNNKALINIQQHGKHIGDMDMFPIFHYKDRDLEYYGLAQDNKIVSFVSVEKNPQANRLYGWRLAFTLDKYRKQQHVKRLLYFIKNKIGYSILDISVRHSPDGINLIKSIGKDNRFKVSWWNSKTGEEVDYNPAEDHDEHQPYRSKEVATDWRILIESSGPCPKKTLFITSGLEGTTTVSGRAPTTDYFHFDESTTYEEMKENLSFCFDKERRRNVI